MADRPVSPGQVVQEDRDGSVAFLIVGAGGHGRVVADLVRVNGGSVLGFCDADPAKLDRVVEPAGGRVLISQDEFLARHLRDGAGLDGVAAVALGIGNNEARLTLFWQLEGFPVPVLAHPRCVISPSARIGGGSVLIPGSVVNAAAQIGVAVIVNTAATVGHDCVIEDGAHIAPGANLCGGVHIGARTWVGAGAVVAPGVRIGRDVMVGAGTVVLRDVPDGATIVGNPGRVVTQ